MTGRLARIHRHPIKSLGWEALERTRLALGQTLPMDRTWAVAHGASGFDDAAPAWVHCRNFLRVTKSPRLAQVAIAYDETAGRVTLSHPDHTPLTADPDSPEDAAAIAEFAGRFAGGGQAGPFRLVRAAQPMTDTPFPSVSVKSLSSLEELSQRMGIALDLRRFRGNLWIDGLDPWEEAGWAGREIKVGAATLRIVEAVGRCAATEANPESGERDAAVVTALRGVVGDADFGVYAEVVEGGEIARGDPVAAL